LETAFQRSSKYLLKDWRGEGINKGKREGDRWKQGRKKENKKTSEKQKGKQGERKLRESKERKAEKEQAKEGRR
jgi:hypothetical protein